MTEPCLRIDFESRSACNLRKAGAWRYSRDPSTEILCLAYRLPSWVVGRVELWNPAFPHLGMEESTNWDALAELLDWVESGGLIEAHNAAFERCIWGNVLCPRFGWPSVPIGNWRCSAAQAAALALPRALGDAGAALGLDILKDDTGHKVMMKVSKPRKSRKKEREQWAKTGETPPALLWHESRELFDQLFAYCKQDILSEEALSNAIPPLSADETAVYTMDQTINARGFQIDREAVECALGLIAKETRALNKELSTVTDGRVKKATQRAQMVEWFAGEGLALDNTQKETIDAALVSTDVILSPSARRGLEIVRTLGRSSTAKYQAMQNWMDPDDGRVRGGLLYHGATTGRWSGSGVQPHNFVRGSVKDMDHLWISLKAGQHSTGVMEALSNGLRGAIVSAPGATLYCVSPETNVLLQSLTWVRADALKSRDVLLAFDEHSGKGKGNQRKFRSSTVKAVRSIQRPRVRITTTEGSITVSADHQFVVRQHKRKGGWAEAGSLRVGDQLAFLSRPWTIDTSNGSGYLAGLLDGEGHVSSHALGWAQNPGLVFDKVCDLLTERGFGYCVSTTKQSSVNKVSMTGGLGEMLRLLGTIQPIRLLSQCQRIWDGRRVWGQRTPTATVLNVELLSEGEVIAVETTTGTLITDGFLSHNCADYASIETRGLFWTADDNETLDVFRTPGACIYCDMATDIYHYPVVPNDHHQPPERMMGKQAILGLGYQMGGSKFQATCDKYKIIITEEFAADVVAAYRTKYPRVVQLWRDQEFAAISAVQSRRQVDCGYVSWMVEGSFLFCELPSGRRLAYPFPQVKKRATPWGAMKDSLTFKGVDPYVRQWRSQVTYGGSIVENIVQALSRDILAEAMLRCEANGYPVVLSVHDEVLSERVGGSKVEFDALMLEVPDWCSGLPIAIDSFVTKRYYKK